jgi:TetR/AcrR family transcriptional regulator, multidrug resistance operon repressor
MRTRNSDKEQLVKDKAIELFVKYGFENFTVNKLARECGISVATLYIYYKHKDDLIIKIGKEEYKKMSEAILSNFNPESSFEEGLNQQWKARAKYFLENPLSMHLFEQIKNSSFQQIIHGTDPNELKDKMGAFVHNAVQRGELNPMPVEVFWSVAFSPLYTLLRFHQDGTSLGDRNFALSEETMLKTLELVIKALRK